MKKLVLLFGIVVLLTTCSWAQNIQLHRDFGNGRNYFTSTVTMFKPDKWGSSFFFIDMNYDNNVVLSYWELARKVKFGDFPVNAHFEYNGGLTNNTSFGNSYLIGPSYSINTKNFSKGITFVFLYKYIDYSINNQPHNFQITIAYYIHFMDGKMTFTGFIDFWKEKRFGDYVLLCEPQLWYNITENLSLGSEIELSNNLISNNFNIMPTLAIKWIFK